jgi:3-hydroxyisobutyrate dehydrogenase-like beta-hydroxyacid dehydrogenase
MTTESARHQIAVLGLGRMGRAMVARLVDRGWDVTTWTRSGTSLPGVTAADDPAAAAQAPIVLLSLFDGPACTDVLERCAAGLGSGTVVVNTSTVGPDEAESLAATVRATGAGYVHAPVLGSTGPARNGALQVLAGPDGHTGHTGEVRADVGALLADLGDVLHLDGPRAAAAAKLVANGVLARALLDVGDARRTAADAGLGERAALDVLQRTAFGGLVGTKRPRLETGDVDDADFTVAALAKDVTLLAEVSPVAASLRERVAQALESGRVGADDDVAALAAVPEGDAAGGSQAR